MKFDLDYWRNRALLAEKLLVPEHNVPPEWGLTRGETEIAAVLSDRRFHRTEEIIERVYFNRDSPTTARAVLRVRVCKMRKKLRKVGMAIVVKWGQGYLLRATPREAQHEGEPK